MTVYFYAKLRSYAWSRNKAKTLLITRITFKEYQLQETMQCSLYDINLYCLKEKNSHLNFVKMIAETQTQE